MFIGVNLYKKLRDIFLCFRLAAAKLNMETALEDAEYMAEELERYGIVDSARFMC